MVLRHAYFRLLLRVSTVMDDDVLHESLRCKRHLLLAFFGHYDGIMFGFNRVLCNMGQTTTGEERLFLYIMRAGKLSTVPGKTVVIWRLLLPGTTLLCAPTRE